MPRPQPSRERAFRALLLLVTAVVCALPAIRPGDVPFGGDEANLLAMAYRANASGRIVTMGLYGSFGAPYGPLPAQIYQLLLLITHDPVALVAIRGVLTTAITAAALFWLARTLRLWAWFVPVVLLSPWLWHFSRLLWDNTFAIPAGAVTVAAYASFLRDRSARSLVIAAAGLVALAAIHFMTAPVVIAVAGHALWRHRPDIRRARWGLAGVAAVAMVGLIAYANTGLERHRLWTAELEAARAAKDASTAMPAPTAGHDAGGTPAPQSVPTGGIPDADGTPAPQAQPVPASAAAPASTLAATAAEARAAAGIAAPKAGVVTAAMFPLRGGRLLSGEEFPVVLTGRGDLADIAWKSARWASLAGIGLVWVGVGLCAWRLWVARRAGRPLDVWRSNSGGRGSRREVLLAGPQVAVQGTDAGSASADAAAHGLQRPLKRTLHAGRALDARTRLGGILLAALLVQMLMYGGLRLMPWSHYLTGTCIVAIVLAWLAVDALPRWARAGLTPVYAASLTVLIGGILLQGRDARPWPNAAPTLRAQLAAARASHAMTATEAFTTVPHLRRTPQTLWCLRLLTARKPPPDASRVVPLIMQDRGSLAVAATSLDQLPLDASRIPLDGPVGLDPFDRENGHLRQYVK